MKATVEIRDDDELYQGCIVITLHVEPPMRGVDTIAYKSVQPAPLEES